jgi:hypothetical protein
LQTIEFDGPRPIRAEKEGTMNWIKHLLDKLEDCYHLRSVTFEQEEIEGLKILLREELAKRIAAWNKVPW